MDDTEVGYVPGPRALFGQAELRRMMHPRSVAVVGLPDEAVGERPAAAVVLAPDAGDDAPARLAAALNEAVRPYERLRAVFTVDELPVSAAGKVLKAALRDDLAGREPQWRTD